MGERQLFNKSSGTWIAVLMASALTLVGLGIFLALRPSQTNQTPSPSTTPAATSPKSGEIAALGRLEPEGEVIKLAAPSTSGAVTPIFGTPRVARLLVPEGAQVKANQVIAVLDVYDRFMAAGMEAQAEVQEAQSRLAQVQAGAKRGDIEAQGATVEARRAAVARSQAAAETARWEYQRYQALFQSGAISEQELRNRQLKFETTTRELDQAKREYDQALKTLSSVAEVRPTDLQQAQAAVNVAMAKFQRAKVDLETSVVRSPINGQVIKIHTRPGEQVGNDGVAEVGNTNQMYTIAEVYETDVQRVKPGQKATITSDAFPGTITGTVTQVGSLIRKKDVLNTDPAADTDARVVEVKVRLDDSRPVAGLTNLQVKVKIQPQAS